MHQDVQRRHFSSRFRTRPAGAAATLLSRDFDMALKAELVSKEAIAARLKDVRDELRRVLETNARQTHHPLARVKPTGDALVVDIERFRKAEMDSKSKVEEVKKNVLERIEFLEKKAEEIKRARFDSMETRRCAVTTFACEEKDEVFRDPVAVTNFGIPMTRKNDGEKEGDEADDVSKVKFLSEVGTILSSESDDLEKRALNALVSKDAGDDEERQIDRLLYDVHFQLQCTTPEQMKMHHALLLRSVRIKKQKFNALFDDVVFEKCRVMDRAKTAWKKAKSIVRGQLKETPAKQLEGIRTDAFYKLKSGLEHGNAWDIVSRLNALANTRPMHSLEEEGKIFDVCESEMSTRCLEESEERKEDDNDKNGIMSNRNNNNNNNNNNSNGHTENMKKALKSMFMRSSKENEDESDGDDDDDDDTNDDDDVSDPSDDDIEEKNEVNINNNDTDDEAPFERNLRLRAKAERFQQKKNKKILEAKKIAFQRLLEIQDEVVKNRVQLNHRVLELEKTKHKVEIEVLSLEYRAARVLERLVRNEILNDECETMFRQDKTLNRLQREVCDAKMAFENHGPVHANAKMRLEATMEQLKMNERQFRRETRDAPAANIHADTLLALYRQDGPVLRKKNTTTSSSSSASSSNTSAGHSSSSTEASSLAAERNKLRRESVFSPASMMQMRTKSIVALTSSGGDVLAGKGETKITTKTSDATTTPIGAHSNKHTTYFPLSLDETWFEKLNAYRTQRQNLEKMKAQQKATREACETTLKDLEQTLDQATEKVSERETHLKNDFNERFKRANDCDVTMKLPCGLVETLYTDEDSKGDDDILYLPRHVVEELNAAANSRRETMINLKIANKKLSASIECSKWYIEYAKRRNSEHIERARELALLRSSKSLQLFIKSGGYNKNSFEEIKKHSNNDCNDESDDEEKEIGDAANAKARFRHNDALHKKERKMCEERLNELEKKKAKLRKTIASLLEDEQNHTHPIEVASSRRIDDTTPTSNKNTSAAKFVISVQ